MDVLPHLSSALGGDGPDEARWASALRLRTRLQPAGGVGAKVMPPTFLGEPRPGEKGPVYITEQRRIDGTSYDCALLDGVASQANRSEQCSEEHVEAGDMPLPAIIVDQQEFGVSSALQFPHRCFDAWVDDALLDSKRFGESDIYKRIATTRSRHDLTAMMETFPIGILLGCWASRSKNQQGTTRLARILSSEIIAVNAVAGQRPASRVDRHHVSRALSLIPTNDHSEQRFEVAQTPAEKRSKSGSKSASPAEFGYGNVPPSIASHGGITMDYALQIVTVSMPALRECRFPADGATVDVDRDVAGRMMLATLALRMLALQVEHGYDLRSGCLLVPEHEPTVELVGRLGRTVAEWPLIDLDTGELLEQAITEGASHGINWNGQKIELRASDPQLTMLRRSLAHAEAVD
jgi:CRISPR-associated protein Csb1